jgi:delta24-sterol reductase
MAEKSIAASAHSEQVAAISANVQRFYENKIPFRIFHGSSNSTRAANRQQIVDISALNNLISIDKVKKVAIVEPGIAMDDVVRRLIPLNLMPAVVPEFPGITAGGAFAGTAAESSSFRHGYFDSAVNKVEMVLGNGDVVLASPSSNADLFYGSAGAMGTLGITTLLEIQLIDCAPFVQVQYHHVTSQDAALERLNNVADDVDFTDAIIFSSRHGVVVEGKFVHANLSNHPLVRFTRASDPWFFTHLHKKFKCEKPVDDFFCMTCHWTQNSRTYAQSPAIAPTIELVPLEDYLFRYERGVFWMACYGWAPKLWNRFTRWFFDAVWHTRFQYRILHLTGGAPHIIQDVAIPAQNASEFLEFMHQYVKVYPLWLCPIKHDARPPMHTAATNTSPTCFLINVGVWGSPNYGLDYLTEATYDRFVGYNRLLEKRVAQAGGLKWLYATNWYKEEEFWSVYTRPAYTALRAKWNADRLPDLWEKVKRSQNDVKEVPLRAVLKAMVWAGLGLDKLVG